MSVNLYSKIDYDTSYKLIELNDDLLELLKQGKNNKGKLQFKSLDKEKSQVVLCSEDKTWILRQKDHSNMSMVMREGVPDDSNVVIDPASLFGLPPPVNDYIGFARTTYEYETIPADGELNLGVVPIYDGEQEFPPSSRTFKIHTFDELLNDSPCSRLESVKRWNQLGGCVINGQICFLSDSFMAKALHVTLMSVMAESLDLDALQLEETFNAVTKDMVTNFNPYTIEVVKSVLCKFGTKDNDTDSWKLNKNAIAKLYGLQALKKYVNRNSMPMDEFMLKWKSLFPPFLPWDIDISMLWGYYYQPQDKHIQYISKEALSMDIKERFRVLFKLQSTWRIEEIQPFVDDLNVKHLKIDSFIMKYARRRKVGKHTLVTSRT